MSSRSSNVAVFLIILVGAFMVLNGVDSLAGQSQGLNNLSHNLSKAFGGSGNTISIVIAVVQIVAGGLLIFGRFVSIGALDKPLRLIIFVFWLALMVFGLFLGGKIKSIDTLDWWISLVNYCIILVILWMVRD